MDVEGSTGIKASGQSMVGTGQAHTCAGGDKAKPPLRPNLHRACVHTTAQNTGISDNVNTPWKIFT